jgi:hypothetical protein
VSENRTFGVNSLVLDRTVGKRFVELMSGKGGLGSLLLWLSQLDFVEGLRALVNSISRKEMFYDTALMKCAKEALKRPEVLREEEIATMLGDVCVGCGRFYSVLGDSPSKCKCGGMVESRYSLVLDKFDKLDINPTPEAVMMWVAYDELSDAYIQGYEAIRKVLATLIEQRGWSSPLQFLDYELKDRLDFSFYYGEPGDQRIAREEREILMFLFRGNIAGIGVAEAENLIRTGVAVMKFGHLFNQLFCSGADIHYTSSLVEFTLLYGKVNEKYRLETMVGRKEREKRTIEVLQLEDKQYYACSLLPDEYWKMGRLANKLVLKPLDKGKLPVFTDEEYVAMNMTVGPSGVGKTTFMSAVICHAINWAGEYVFNVMGDEKNGLTLASLPLFPCEGRTSDLLKILKDMDVPAKSVPCLNLTFLRPNEEIKKNMYPAHPPTIFDRVVLIDDVSSFGFDFYTKGKKIVETKDVVGNRGVLDILEEFALNLGYKRLCGLFNVRNLLRQEDEQGKFANKDAPDVHKPDIQIATKLFSKFATFRQNSKFPSARIAVDEMSRLGGSQHNLAGGDTSRSSATLADTIKSLRGANTSIDGGTQKWSEISGEPKAEALNIFFRELPKTGDKTRSQRDLILDSLDLIEGRAEKELVARIMETKAFPRENHFWFWYNKHRGSVQVVRPNPPTFMINQPRKTNLEVFRAYEKFDADHSLARLFGHENILLDSWDEVPKLSYKTSDYAGRKHVGLG